MNTCQMYIFNNVCYNTDRFVMLQPDNKPITNYTNRNCIKVQGSTINISKSTGPVLNGTGRVKPIEIPMVVFLQVFFITNKYMYFVSAS